MAKEREFVGSIEQQRYFKAAPHVTAEEDEGTRELGPLYPFLISGGTNTERYYFTHINDTTAYKFNIIPKYFGNESSYTEIFPGRIRNILKNNVGAKVYCIFDLDTVYSNKTNQDKHKAFQESVSDEIRDGSVVLCPSMPGIEYWFLLHFENYTDLIKSCGTKMQKLLAPHMMPFFPDTNKKLINLLKDKKYINKPAWVIALCADGKLETAIKRAEDNIKTAIELGNLDKQSYSFVYKAFKQE